jgi:hypothetical protein
MLIRLIAMDGARTSGSFWPRWAKQISAQAFVAIPNRCAGQAGPELDFRLFWLKNSLKSSFVFSKCNKIIYLS